MDNDVNVITLLDEDGEEKEFNVITKLDIEDKEYVIVVPNEESEDDESEAMALRIDKDSEGNDVLVVVEDDDEFEVVNEAYETLFFEDETEE
ncbi:MAG: DUF1292 domain-containing protein [Bacillota bacterium]|nr:DUF1292 domain-containing protein [Bacillota bacterium]